MKPKKPLKAALLLAGVALALPLADAATLVAYDINSSGDTAAEPSTEDVITSSLTKVLGVGGGNFGGNGWLFNGTNFSAHGNDGGDLVVSDADDRIFTFSLTAGAGKTLSVDAINWRVGVNPVGTIEGYHYSLFYVSDQSDFSNILAQSGDIGQTTANAPGGTAISSYQAKNLSFSGLNLTGYTTLYFAIESSNNASVGAEDLVYQSFDVQGTVVPEPSAAALMGLGLTGLMFRRRRA